MNRGKSQYKTIDKTLIRSIDQLILPIDLIKMSHLDKITIGCELNHVK
jgi:hypothetical protein